MSVGVMGALPLALLAQVPAAVTRAAETITGSALAQQVEELRADSLRSGTPGSPTLDRLAHMLVAQLQHLGLQPGPPVWSRLTRSDQFWEVRYPLPGQQRLNYATSSVNFFSRVTLRGKRVITEDETEVGNVRASASLANAAYIATEVMNDAATDGTNPLAGALVAGGGRAVLVAGPQTPALLAAVNVDLTDHVVIYVPPAHSDTALERVVLNHLYTTSRGVVIVRATDSTAFAGAVAAAQRQPRAVVDEYLLAGRRWAWAITVQPQTVMRVLAAVGVDLPAVQAITTPLVQVLWGMDQVSLEAGIDSSAPPPRTAPIVLGMVPGTDSLLASEYVVLMTTLDPPNPAELRDTAAAIRARNMNVAGLLAMARAFADSAVRPRRPVVFVATSGEQGQPPWGISALLAGSENRYASSTALVFDVGSGRGGDSLVIDGTSVLQQLPSPAWVATMQPERGLTVIDEGTDLAPESSAAVFLRGYTPTLALHRPVGEPLPTAASTPAEFDRAARAFRYMFYLGYELTDAEKPTRWTAEGRREFLHLRREP